MGDYELTEIDFNLLEEYFKYLKEDKTQTVAGINRNKKTLKTIFKYATKHSHLDENPMEYFPYIPLCLSTNQSAKPFITKK